MSSDVRELQFWNIFDILVTDDVSKLLMSRYVRELQPLNIHDILVTADVSKLLTSSDMRELQFWNILSILVRELEKVGFIISLTEVMPKKPLSVFS